MSDVHNPMYNQLSVLFHMPAKCDFIKQGNVMKKTVAIMQTELKAHFQRLNESMVFEFAAGSPYV